MLGLPKLNICVSVLGRLPHCIVSAQNLFLEVLGLPKLILSVIVIGRLPICVCSAPEMICRGAGLAEAKYFGHHPWQTAYLRFLCPGFGVEVLGLPKLILCVAVLGRLPICVLSAPELVVRGAGLA